MKWWVVMALGAVSVSGCMLPVDKTEPPDADARVHGGEPTGAATAACIWWGPPPTGVVADRASLDGEQTGTATAACWAWGPTPHGVIMDPLNGDVNEESQ